jgi:membrane-bound lytic murein transglycosylase MltF
MMRLAICCAVAWGTVACSAEPETVDPEIAVQSEAESAEASPETLSTVAEIDDPWLRPGRVAAWTGDLDGMVERGVVRILSVANRTHFFVDGARKRGIVAEKANALREMLNERFASTGAVKVVVIPVRRDQLLPMLTGGYGDVAIGNLTVTTERQEIVDFSPPFVSNVRELVVVAPGVGPIETPEDLSGLPIWVRRSSSYYSSLQSLNDRFIAEGREPIELRAADENLEDEGLLEMVNGGLYEATVVDSHKLDWLWGKVFHELTVTDVALREKGEIAAAIRKDSPQLEALLADFYRENRVGTTFGNTIVNRYARNSRWIHNPAATEDRRRFDEVVDLFKKYSERYGFDHLMMVAQGYQESRLDQNARSPVGAIGIMQLMPATAAGSPIFMPDVSTAEANIHAGVKYMRYLMDRHFADPEIDEVNRYLLAFAAYNAGPTRITRLRARAPEYGVDPNQWFKNMQYVVASTVSQEPIRYVGNIYKYYLVYRRLRDIKRERALATGG